MAEGIGFTKEVFTTLRPGSLGTVLGWYRADSLTAAEDDLIATLVNQEGAFPNLAQATSGNKPKYKSGAANGQPALLFDGTNDFMQTSSFAAESQPITVFVVAKRNASGSDNYLLDGIGVSNRLVVEHIGSTGKLEANAGSSITSFADFGTDWFVAQVVFDGASSKIWINDLPAASGNVGAGTLTGITLGASYVPNTYWNGYWAETIYFDGTLSTDDAYTVRRALQAKYKIDYFDPSTLIDVSKFFGDSLRYRDGEGIALWEDQVSGYDVIQATTANQPLAVRDELNHRTVARFDGSNDYLRSVAFSALSQPKTIYAVAKNTSNAANRFILDGIASGNRHAIYFPITTGNVEIYAGTQLNSGVAAGLGWNIITAQFNGGSSLIRRNGTQENTGAAGSHTLTGYTIGAQYDNSFPFIGDVYALLVGSGAHSTVNMQRVEAWLKGLTAL